MKHLFVPYELAVKLMNKGFDEVCLAGFLVSDDGQFCIFGLDTNHETGQRSGNDWVTTPLYQQVIDWLREEHSIDVRAVQDWSDGNMLGYCGIMESEDGLLEGETFDDYYTALTDIINEALNVIK